MSSITILLVDDDIRFRGALEDILQSYGYNIITAGNGEEALEVISKNEIDLAIIDGVMPKMDGFETTKQIRKIYGDELLIIFFTGVYAGDFFAKQALEYGANLYIKKPIEPPLLLEKIKRLTQKKSNPK